MTALGHLVVLGTGDLTRRYLVPAVAELAAARPADGLHLTLVGQQPLSADAARSEIRSWLGDRDQDEVAALLDCTRYASADVTDPELLRAALPAGEPFVAYLALPPAVFPGAIEALHAAGLPQGSRIVVEKPFGDDARSAATLNELLARVLPEDAVFRVDHFLGMQTAQDLLMLRFGNRVFEPLWNAEHIERVEVVWDETLSLHGRAGYYDRTGALRDMVQNHLLQLLCLVAMEPPGCLTSAEIADRKVEVLRATRPADPAGSSCSRRGRYTAGRVGDRDVPAYVDEPGVEPARGTETFAEVVVEVGTERWEGVPFTLRSGKALARDRHHVVVHFRPAAPVAFAAERPPPNQLRFEFGPERVVLTTTLSSRDGVFDPDGVALSSAEAQPGLGAYARVLDDVLHGGNVLSVRGDEAVEAWRVVQPVIDAWDRDEVPLLDYAAGSTGP